MAKKLLLADDSVTIQKVVGITFAQEDFDITYVDNGLDAINKVGALQPDIVLADIVMPQKNGYDVCEAIKKNPALKHVPVLLLAGTFETFDVNRGKLVGADDYIIKPFESQALIDKVNALLQGKGAAEKPSPSLAAKPIAAKPAPSPVAQPQVTQPQVATPPVAPATPPRVTAPSSSTPTSAPASDDFAFDNTETFDLGLGLDSEGSEPAPEATVAEGATALPIATAAEIMMDQSADVAATPAAEAIDLPASGEFSFGDPFGLEGGAEEASSNQAEPKHQVEHQVDLPTASLDQASSGEGLDLPPLPEDGGFESALDSTSTDDQPFAQSGFSDAGNGAQAVNIPTISEEEVRQLVAARVQEMVEKIAWEVIPDLAERLIQDEIKRLTDTAGSAGALSAPSEG